MMTDTPDLIPCACGCGEFFRPWREKKYVSRLHKHRVNNRKRSEGRKKTDLCACGCGTEIDTWHGKRYVDLTHKSRAYRGRKSETSTAPENREKVAAPVHTCRDCGKVITSGAVRCAKCASRQRATRNKPPMTREEFRARPKPTRADPLMVRVELIALRADALRAGDLRYAEEVAVCLGGWIK